MKKISMILCAAAVFAAAVPLPAPAAVEVEGGAYVGFFDKYLWRGYDLSGSGGVIQGGMDLSHKGFTLSYWTNIQANDDKEGGFPSGEATENDITLDYSFDLTEMVSLNVGNIFYDLEGLADTNEAYVGVTVNTLLEPTLTAYYDWDECEEDGLYLTAVVGHGFDLAEGLSLSLGALVGYNQESDYAVGDYSDWHNYELSVGIDYAVNENISISPSFLFSSPISDEAKALIDSETVGGLTLSFTF
ncbi:TorF family putative porin [Trichloromonas sp.]|uniref:TorF family putative porin n=1 Tax=Trichloromonas sp. TaxID=3069249 RepID=UPI002A431469|nr:TorF family putative porin [Trichloromonas sp.]